MTLLVFLDAFEEAADAFGDFFGVLADAFDGAASRIARSFSAGFAEVDSQAEAFEGTAREKLGNENRDLVHDLIHDLSGDFSAGDAFRALA